MYSVIINSFQEVKLCTSKTLVAKDEVNESESEMNGSLERKQFQEPKKRIKRADFRRAELRRRSNALEEVKAS